MTMTDPIADMLTRIRNSYKMKHKTVSFPASNIKFGICEVLKNEGYIKECSRNQETKPGTIEVTLKYSRGGKEIIHEIRRISKPGRRLYVACEDIKKVKGGLGISVLSTSKGIISDRTARKEQLGGELLCTIW